MYMASTRYNNDTHSSSMEYRRRHKIPAIYGSNIRIATKCPVGAFLFVAEMNNSTNKIEGIGLIKNIVSPEKYKIYSNSDYNRYVYRGQYWLSREELKAIDPDIVSDLEVVLFYGKTHLKRGSGISILTEKLFLHWKFELKELLTKVKNAFVTTFKSTFKKGGAKEGEGELEEKRQKEEIDEINDILE